ncbi:cytochrome c oxidase assembly factor 4 homolog, mitochondrial isoform X1 [Ursus americanus]|uniref:cytochrome c oxidase assembly factor 4 homolog, mitochondrial isoform X1 n=1 Tax=Ursus americanus TaxID=9643 RepID=UPI001E679968|nr:cytochrome c oxidase assembly factor 4 homolog, mitochondrial isoform X1 [Ursus americanus]
MNTRGGFLSSHFRAQAPHRRTVFGLRVGRVPIACKTDADVLERASDFSCPTCSRLPKMSTQGHTWARQVKKEGEEEDPLDQLISRSGCAASHYAVQECMAQHQDWRQCQPQVQAFRDCMSEQQARRREELQRRKEQGSAHR